MVFLDIVTIVIGVRVKPRQLIQVDKDVRFDLYTPKNPTEHQILQINDADSITQSNYNPEFPTRIFIHGFQSKGELKSIFTDGKRFLIFHPNGILIVPN